MDKVCAVIVTYNPSQDLIVNVEALLPQVAEVIIVDNGSGDPSRRLVADIGQRRGVRVIYEGRNLGIATALNDGVAYAARAGFGWVATFDQDSLPPADFIETLMAAYESCSDRARVALVSPTYVDRESGERLGPATANNRFISSTMTSGNLVKTNILTLVGPFEDRFFIDYVDHEFCLRLRQRGYLILSASEAVLYHSLGRRRRHRLFGAATNHSSLRRYYITRNRFIVYRRYFGFDPAWVLRDLKAFIKETAKIILIEDEAWPKLNSIALGLWHALRGRSGEAPPQAYRDRSNDVSQASRR